MKRSVVLRCLLALLVVSSLVTAPLAAPAAASVMAATQMGDMAADMPCCPDMAGDTAPHKNDCKDCPLMTVCILKSMQGVPVAVERSLFAPDISTLMAPFSDAVADSLGSSPPARPPRSLV
ncbi:hypothetical protein CIW50_17870 [Tardiphaga sp. P9-11]|nr:hypothetical protein CIW50_17870 [Tardiphaga sp. P9-11]